MALGAYVTTHVPSAFTKAYSRLTAGLFHCVFIQFTMKVLSSLRKRTTKGTSTWKFFVDAELGCFAIGGENKTIWADDKDHLRQIYNNFKRYGYTHKLPAKPQWISDPWASELPAKEQMALEALA